MTILVSGFDTFESIVRNPSKELVNRLDGSRIGSKTIVGAVLDVTYRAVREELFPLIRGVRPELILCFGVAASRQHVEIESIARYRPDSRADTIGECWWETEGPSLQSTASVAAIAGAFDARVSEDAGSYVCNATLYSVLRAFPGIATCFVHIPLDGMAPERVLDGLSALSHSEGKSRWMKKV